MGWHTNANLVVLISSDRNVKAVSLFDMLIRTVQVMLKAAPPGVNAQVQLMSGFVRTFSELCSWRKRFISSALICSTGTPDQVLTTASTSAALTMGSMAEVTPTGPDSLVLSCSSRSLQI